MTYMRTGSKMQKVISIAALAIICAGGFIVWHGTVSRERLQNEISKIHEGMTRTEVIQTLGQPDEFRKPCIPSGHGCDQDLVYHVPLEVASFWTVSLDASGHVIDKFQWHSP
jgi:hypothetical protein